MVTKFYSVIQNFRVIHLQTVGCRKQECADNWQTIHNRFHSLWSKQLVVFLLLLLGFQLCYTQQALIDSLERESKIPTNGKSKLENLVQLGYAYIFINQQKSLDILDNAIDIAHEKNDSVSLGYAHIYKGANYFTRGEDPKGFQLYEKAEIIFKAIDYPMGLGTIYSNKAIIYANRKRHKKAIETYRNAYQIFDRVEDSLYMSLIRIQIGKESWRLGDYTVSMQEFVKAQKLLDKISDPFIYKEVSYSKQPYYADLNVSLGALNQSLGKFDDALLNFENALTFFQETGSLHRLAAQYLNIASIYIVNKKDYKAALTYVKDAYKLYQKTNNIVGMGIAYSNFGKVYYFLNQYDKALAYSDSAIVINRRIQEYGLLAENYKIKGTVYQNRKQFTKAQNAYDQSLTYANETNELEQKHELKLRLSFLASNQRKYKVAYNYLEEARILKDSLLSDEKKEEIAVLKAQYEFDKQKAIIEANFEKEQALEKAETERQIFIRNLSIIGALVLMALFLGAFFLWRKKREADYQAQLSATKQQSLKAQMNPHFVFNTLSSINDYVLKNDGDTASDYLIKFSKVVRRTLENTEETEISLAMELEHLQNYVSLEQRRALHNFTFNVVIQEDIDPTNTLLPPALLQPFLENSIWHGLSEKEAGKLSLSFYKEEEHLVSVIEDNGVGIQQEEVKKSHRKSFGLENIKNRLKLLNQSQKNKSFFDINNKEDGGVKVVVRLPYIVDI